MRHRIGTAVICLRAGEALYIILAVAAIPLMRWLHSDRPYPELGTIGGLFLLFFCLAMVVGIEVVLWGLTRRRYWAWVAGLCIFGTQVPSLFLPLGVIGLRGLLDEGTRAQFIRPAPPGGRTLTQPATATTSRHRVGMAVICLHISAAVYVFLALLPVALWLSDRHLPELGTVIFFCPVFFCLMAMSFGTEVVVWGLFRRKFWAWVAGLCIFGLYVRSLFLPLGALGLWGLLDDGSRAQFMSQPKPPAPSAGGP